MLEAAYNDSAGVTAAFNRNMLAVLNRELDADFDLDVVRARRVLRPRAGVDRDAPAGACGRWTCTSRKLGLDVHFANREELRTEISAKFTRERLEADLRAAGLVLISS